MSGTKEGGKKAATSNKAKHGEDFYKNIGRKGGGKSHPETRPFTKDPELAKRAGRAGGLKSKRGKSKKKLAQEVAQEVQAEAASIRGLAGILAKLRGKKNG